MLAEHPSSSAKISPSLFESHSVQFSSAFSVLCPHTEHTALPLAPLCRLPLPPPERRPGQAIDRAHISARRCSSVRSGARPMRFVVVAVFHVFAVCRFFVFTHISLCSVLQCSFFPFLSFPFFSALIWNSPRRPPSPPPTHADNLTITSSSKASPTSTFWTCYKFGQIKLLTPLLLLLPLLLLTCTSTTEIYLQSGFVFSQCVLAQFVVGGSRDHRGTVHFKKAYSTSASSTSYSSFLSSSSSSSPSSRNQLYISVTLFSTTTTKTTSGTGLLLLLYPHTTLWQ